MSDTEIEAMAGRTAYNPWRVSIENILTGDNYLRSSEWHDLLADLDRLYALETNADAIRAAERERAAAWVDARREAFCQEHGSIDPDTGALEFGRGPRAEAKTEYVGELEEIAAAIRALK